jgi:hypothetical protein
MVLLWTMVDAAIVQRLSGPAADRGRLSAASRSLPCHIRLVDGITWHVAIALARSGPVSLRKAITSVMLAFRARLVRSTGHRDARRGMKAGPGFHVISAEASAADRIERG